MKQLERQERIKNFFLIMLLCSVPTILYSITTVFIIKELVLVFLAPLIFFSTFHVILFIKRRLFFYKLDRDFLDFITILMSFESNGLSINDLFNMAIKHEISLPRAYRDLARMYVSIESVTGSSYKALNILARNLPRSKLRNFIEGYVGILETTGNTLEFIESYINSELSRLEDSMNNLLNIIENFYEAYLVILLSLIVLSSFPSIYSLSDMIYLALVCMGFVGYFIASFIAEKLYYQEPTPLTLSALTLIAITYVFLKNNMFIETIVVAMVATLISYLLWKQLYSWMYSVEEQVYELSEDIYVESSQGFSLDTALINLSSRTTSYSRVAKELAGLIKLGIKGHLAGRLLRLPPLSKKILSLLLAPLEITSSKDKHIGYILKFFRRIRSIRNSLSNRVKTLYAYVLLLPPTIYAVAYALKTMDVTEYLPIDPYIIPGYVLLSSMSAWLVVNRIAKGCGLGDIKILIILLENLILYLWLIL